MLRARWLKLYALICLTGAFQNTRPERLMCPPHMEKLITFSVSWFISGIILELQRRGRKLHNGCLVPALKIKEASSFTYGVTDVCKFSSKYAITQCRPRFILIKLGMLLVSISPWPFTWSSLWPLWCFYAVRPSFILTKRQLSAEWNALLTNNSTSEFIEYLSCYRHWISNQEPSLLTSVAIVTAF